MCVHVYIFTGACVQARQYQQVFFRSCTHVHIHLQYMGGCVFRRAHTETRGQRTGVGSLLPTTCPRNQTQGARLSDERYSWAISHTLYFLRWPLTGSWNLQINLHWPANKPRGGTCLYLSRSRITNCAIYSSGPHAYTQHFTPQGIFLTVKSEFVSYLKSNKH